MKKRWIQSLGILIVFAIAATAVVWLGLHQGKRQQSVSESGVQLSEKKNWDESLPTDSADEGQSTIVYKTENGKKYHLYSDCSALRNTNTVIGITKETAEKEGKELCSVCEKRNKTKGT